MVEIKVTNLEIWAGVGAVGALSQQKFPVKTALALAKLATIINDVRKPIEEVRMGLVKEYYDQERKDEKGKLMPGGPFLKDGKSKDDFQKEFDELMAKEEVVNLEALIKLPEQTMSTCDKCHHNMPKPLELEPWILQALQKFVEVG